MKPWSHLPNARLIDYVLASVKENSDIWVRARHAARNAARNAARDSILALVAYDDCDAYLGISYEQLKVYALLGERPQAILLLSLKRVQEHETLVTTS